MPTKKFKTKTKKLFRKFMKFTKSNFVKLKLTMGRVLKKVLRIYGVELRKIRKILNNVTRKDLVSLAGDLKINLRSRTS